jgi:putative multiple sugar transport system ATP-binding protein
MISSEMPELLGMCDRIYVMAEGAFVGELTSADATQERIMSLIVSEHEKQDHIELEAAHG